MTSLYLPPGTPPDLAAEHPRRASRPLTLADRCRRSWRDWQDRRRGWVRGPDGRYRPPKTRLPAPGVLIALGAGISLVPARRGLMRRVLAALFDND